MAAPLVGRPDGPLRRPTLRPLGTRRKPAADFAHDARVSQRVAETSTATVRRGRVRLATIAVAVCFVALFALPVHVVPCGTQASHYALVRSLAVGTPRIDEYVGRTCDLALYRDHYYSVKPPGLAFAALPAYLALDHSGLLPDDQRWVIWLLSLSTLIPAALLLVYLVWRTAERLLPGSGRLTAVALGAGTIVLPFASLWFGQVPATMLAFAAFAVALGDGTGTSERRAFAAGLLAGAAVLFEYPHLLVAAALLVYVAAGRSVRAPLAFLAGGAVPAAALAAYNQWAFGSIWHMSYRYALPLRTDADGNIVGVNDVGFFGLTWPSADALAELLFSPRGLLTLSPVCLAAAAGIVLLYRYGRREALLLGAIVVGYLVYNAGYTLNDAGPFGGDAPGPRFLVAMLPFLLLPLGLVARAVPGPVAALLAVSVGAMSLVTATTPILGAGEEGRWWRELRSGTFVETPLTLVGAGGWAAIAPFAAAAAGLLAFAVHDLLRGARTAPVVTLFGAAAAAVAWLLALEGSHSAYRDGSRWTAAAAYALAALLIAMAAATGRTKPWRTAPRRPDRVRWR
jgi:hypothetical protein